MGGPGEQHLRVASVNEAIVGGLGGAVAGAVVCGDNATLGMGSFLIGVERMLDVRSCCTVPCRDPRGPSLRGPYRRAGCQHGACPCLSAQRCHGRPLSGLSREAADLI